MVKIQKIYILDNTNTNEQNNFINIQRTRLAKLKINVVLAIIHKYLR